MFCRHFECGQKPGGEFRKQTWNNEQCRQIREKRNFLIKGRRFRRSFETIVTIDIL